MARYYTRDRRFRATDKNLDGTELIQLDRKGHNGSWVHVADLRELAQAARWVHPSHFIIPTEEERPKWAA